MPSPQKPTPQNISASQAGLSAASEMALTSLVQRAPLASSLATVFQEKGFTLALVGGPVRDALLGRLGNDLDFTTNAPALESKKILQKWADNVWDTGIEFGTVAAKRGETTVEITTYRSDTYSNDSRKPDVVFGTSIEGDLSRRDFTVNSMALELTGASPVFIDPYGGLIDLANKVLRTPGTPEDSFSDDPLRMLRAARFASQLKFEIAPEVLRAMAEMTDRLEIISAERIRDEITKLLMSAHPRIGITILVDTGLAAKVLPEIPRLRLEVDEHHHHKDVYEHSITVLEQAIALEDRLGGPNLVIRLAALLHDIGKALDHEVSGSHVEIGRRILQKFGADERIIKAMQSHHDEYPYETIESVIVQVADAISGGRPGARREGIENYIKRLDELEGIANSFTGVENAYAIQAGREIRVFVKPEEVSDLEARKVAREIATRIENELKFPGEIKVTVIRENKIIEYAR
jgi:poly(A) polymerase